MSTPPSMLRSRWLPARLAATLTLAGLGAVATLAGGCKDHVVQGNRPVSIQLLDGQTGQVMTEHVVQQCVPESLIMEVIFEDGSIGNFSNRAGTTFNSSDNTIVQVSAGIQTFGGLNGGSFITGSGGVLVPQANGTATITGTYEGLTATTRVRVTDAPSDIRLVRNDTDPLHTAPGLTTGQTQTLAPNTALGFDIVATVRGIQQTLSGQADWTLTASDTGTATDPGIAVLSQLSNGTEAVASVAASNTPQVLTARPPACNVTLGTNLAVTTPTGVTLDREIPGTLLVSASPVLQPVERFILTARFPDGKTTQDVSAYGAFTASDATVLLFGGQGTSTRNFGAALGAGTSTVTATFNPTTNTADTTALLTSNTLQVPVAADTLTGLAVTTPPSKTVTLAPGHTTQLGVTGTFASGASQDITRRTVFTAADPQLVGVVSGASSIGAGQTTAGTTPANGAYGSGGTTTVTASVPGLTPTDYATVTVPALVSP